MDVETIKTYDAMAQEYDAETTDFWKKFPNNFINEFQKSVNHGLVLDIGSGPGRDGMLLKEFGLHTICLDASRSMVEMTSQKGLLSVQADFTKIPFKDNAFNGVWAYTSLLHIPKSALPEALKEIRRVLHQEAVLGLGFIEGDSEGYKLSAGVDRPRWFAHYTKQEINNILYEGGFNLFYFDQFRPRSSNYLNILAKKTG